MMKSWNKLQIEGNFFKLVKGIYEKPTGNIILNKKLNAVLLRSGTRERCLLQPIIFFILGDLPGAIRHKKKIKDMHIRKKEVKLYPQMT